MVGRRGVPLVKYSAKVKEPLKKSAIGGGVLLLLGIFVFLASGLMFLNWCFFTGFLMLTAGTFLTGFGAMLVWKVRRIAGYIFSMASVLLFTTFMFWGAC